MYMYMYMYICALVLLVTTYNHEIQNLHVLPIRFSYNIIV